jgi:hypothetical protein
MTEPILLCYSSEARAVMSNDDFLQFFEGIYSQTLFYEFSHGLMLHVGPIGSQAWTLPEIRHVMLNDVGVDWVPQIGPQRSANENNTVYLTIVLVQNTYVLHIRELSLQVLDKTLEIIRAPVFMVPRYINNSLVYIGQCPFEKTNVAIFAHVSSEHYYICFRVDNGMQDSIPLFSF